MRPTLAAGLLAVLAVGISSGAAPYTPYFNMLDGELRLRRDNDFGGTLDRTAKKQQKAVLKSLALLEKTADDLGDDLRTAASVANLLEKAYPGEFAPTLTVAAMPLDGLLDQALDDLTGDVLAGAGALSARIASVTPRAAAAVQKAVDAADAALGTPYATRAARAKLLQKAWKQVLKGNRIADKGQGGGAESLAFTLDGGPAFAAAVHADVFSGDDGLQVSGIYLPAGGGLVTVYVTLPGVTGPGSYPISGTGSAAAYIVYDPDFTEHDWFLVPGSGTIVLENFDVAGKNISGYFDFTATGTSTVQVHVDFTVTQGIEVNAGSLP